MKPYKFALLLGRFQVLHLGHTDMLKKASEVADCVGVLIGSAQESGTEKNPLTYEQRKRALEAVFGDTVTVFPLPDIGVGNNAKWGDYVLDQTESLFGRLPDVFVSGREQRRVDWFDNPRGLGIAELYVPKTVPISATEMRAYLREDRREAWQSYSDPRLWPLYEEQRAAVLATVGHTETASL